MYECARFQFHFLLECNSLEKPGDSGSWYLDLSESSN